MKIKKILMFLFILVTMCTFCNVANAVQLQSITDVIQDNVETLNYDKTDYPDLRGKTFTMMVYAYINPAFGRGVTDNASLPEPFTVYHTNAGTGTQTFFTGYFYNSEEGRYNAYLLYCSGYRVPINTGASVPSQIKVYDWRQKEMDDETKNLISLALIYGFDTDMGYGSAGSEATGMVRNDPNRTGKYVYGHVRECFATQMVVWLASTKQIGTEGQDAILKHFCKIDGELQTDAYNMCNDMISKIQTALKVPSYSSETEAEAPVYEMKWNPDTARFEYKLTDTNGLNTADKVAIKWQLENTGINAEVNGNEVTLWTKDIVGTKDSPVTLKAEKVINGGKGVAGFWQNPTYNNGDPSQPMTRLLGIDREKEYSYIKVYTSGIRIGIEKELIAVNGKYGDATVEGCKFGVYRDEACTDEVAVLTIGKDGKSDKTEYVPYQTYYVKEIEANSTTFENDKVLVVDPTKADTDEDGDFVVTVKAQNDIITTELRVIKYANDTENTEENPAVGAVLRLALNSDPQNEYYQAIVQKNGVAVFTDIPTGTYTLSEDDTNSNYLMEIDEEVIKMTQSKEERTYRVIVSDEPIPVYPKVIKMDSLTKKVIAQAGAQFKIWDCQKNDWVTQMRTPDGAMIDVFETNEKGEFITPSELVGGEYVLYEVKAPEGYYLNPKYTIPANKSDLGNADVAGIKLSLTTQIAVQEDERGNLIYPIEVENEPLKGKIKVIKTGEMLTDVSTEVSDYGDIMKPSYNYRGLEGVEYTITLLEDAKSPDGKQVYQKAGKQYVITTDENGEAITEELYLGTYKIEETKTPDGFVTDKNIPNITVTNTDETERVKTNVKELQNIKQKTEIELIKEFEKSKFVLDQNEKIEVVIGIYADQEFKNYNQKEILIKQHDLVDVVKGECDVTGTKITLKSEVNLPAGKYYAYELDVSSPYQKDGKEHRFEIKHTNTDDVTLKVQGPTIINAQPTAGSLILIKFSASSFIDAETTGLSGNNIDMTLVDQNLADFISKLKDCTKDEAKAIIKSYNKVALAKAEYGIYLDKECTKPLKEINFETGEIKEVKIITDESGMYELPEIPVGMYYLKEKVAPAGYEISDKVIPIDINLDSTNQIVYRAIVDTMPFGPEFIVKKDIFTGDAIPNCLFEIKDENGKVIVHSRTDENGNAWVLADLLDNGATYTYTEIEAPGIYDLNTEPHTFVAKYELNLETGHYEWLTEKQEVENRRKTIDELIVRKLDEETGEPLEGCKFSIVLLDEEGNPFINEDGEMVYLVKEAVTGENGEYVVENPYYGSYQFIEVEAPEGYEMKEDMNGMTFVIDENSPETIIFEVTNTGDIAVIALAAVAVLSIIGIVFVIIRNKKSRK